MLVLTKKSLRREGSPEHRRVEEAQGAAILAEHGMTCCLRRYSRDAGKIGRGICNAGQALV